MAREFREDFLSTRLFEREINLVDDNPGEYAHYNFWISDIQTVPSFYEPDEAYELYRICPQTASVKVEQQNSENVAVMNDVQIMQEENPIQCGELAANSDDAELDIVYEDFSYWDLQKQDMDHCYDDPTMEVTTNFRNAVDAVQLDHHGQEYKDRNIKVLSPNNYGVPRRFLLQDYVHKKQQDYVDKKQQDYVDKKQRDYVHKKKRYKIANLKDQHFVNKQGIDAIEMYQCMNMKQENKKIKKQHLSAIDEYWKVKKKSQNMKRKQRSNSGHDFIKDILKLVIKYLL